MELELLKALPAGGSLMVCVALVILFLKHIKEAQEVNGAKTEHAIQAMAERFQDEHAKTREAFQTQIEAITNKVFNVVDSTTSAIKGLESAVRELQEKLK